MDHESAQHFVHLVTACKDDRLIGEKARGIQYLIRTGFSVPLTYICTSDAYDEYLQGNPHLRDYLKAELGSKLKLEKSYSVRSSATLEDNPNHSFAGQFKTFLHVQGIPQILKAIEEVWKSTKSDRVIMYSKKSSVNLKKLKMAVIIQPMVKAETSGVVFTKNPLNGRDEVIVEFVPGLGDSLLQRGANPNRGVYKWGEWIEKPEDDKMPLHLLENLVEKSKSLEKKRRTPLNLEWAYDGHKIFWLQLREITTLHGLQFYSNQMAKEFLPGVIKPLVWSVNIPVVCGAWIQLLSELVGNLNIRPQDLAKQFYYRAYFNMGVIGDIFDAFGMPREGLEVLMGYGANAPDKPSLRPGLQSLRHLPKLLLFTFNKLFFEGKMTKFIQNNDVVLEKFYSQNLKTMNENGTINAINELFRYNAKAAYFVIVSQLLSGFYNKLLMDQMEKKGGRLEDFYHGFMDNWDIDPNTGIRKLHHEYIKLSEETTRRLELILLEGGDSQGDEVNGFVRSFHEFIKRFGHLSDQENNFASIHWNEQPRLVLDMVINYESRSPVQTTQSEEKSHRKSGVLLNWIYLKARENLAYKERISFNYTKSYGLFRRYFLHIAKIFRMKGYLKDSSDLFYLTFDEIQEVVDRGKISDTLARLLSERKREIAETEDITLPDVIYGDEAPTPIKQSGETQILHGIPASGGYYMGKTCVVKGSQDFSKVTQGVVLLIPFSEISWIPVIAKAGAVISESGGILSHSAVIAREYGIPSIVGVKRVCNLGDGRRVYVDGFSGKISIR